MIYHNQCCQGSGLPAELGYFEIACRGSKNCWVGGLKLGYFSAHYPQQLFFLQICQFQRVFEPFQCTRTFFSSISGIMTSWRVINIDKQLLSTSCGSQQSNWFFLFCFVFVFAQMDDFGYLTAEKRTNLGNLAQARSQEQFWGVRDPPKVDLLDPKSGLFWTSPPLPSYKNPIFWPTLWLKVDLLADLGLRAWFGI